MKNFLLFTFIILSFFSCNQDESYFVNDLNVDNQPTIEQPSNCDFTAPIYSNVSSSEELLSKLQSCFTPLKSYSYSQARTYLYSDVDVIDGELQTIYTNTKATINPGTAQSYIDAAFQAGINCEHVYPQSKGSKELPARSDMYHIYPALDYVNGARSAYPFANIDSTSGVKWYKGREKTSSKPANESEWSKGKTGAFEPRDDKKGDIARSVFYFYTVYNQQADKNFFNGMRSTLLQWHKDDPVSNEEQIRSEKIAKLQGNYNPYILDETLAERVF